MSSIPKLLMLLILFINIKAQLTIQDKDNIENFLLKGQSKSTGLFFESSDALKHTREAIVVLKALGLDIKHKTEICKQISNSKEIDYNIVLINKLLNCKLDIKNFKPEMNKNKLYELYHQAQIMEELQIDQWGDLFKKVKTFYSQGEGKFSFLKIKVRS